MKSLIIVLLLASFAHNASASTKTIRSSFNATIQTVDQAQAEYEASMINNGFIKTSRAFVKLLSISSEIGDSKNESECLKLVEEYEISNKTIEASLNDQCLDQSY